MSEKKTTTTAAVVPTEHTPIRPQRPRNDRRIQNFLLVWLDESINEDNNDDSRNTISKLREVVNTVHTFTDTGECINFITDIKTEKAFIISSGAFGQTTVPIVHDMAQVSTIYILCGNKTRHEQWVQKWPKVKGVFTDIKPIYEALKKSVRECDQNAISMSFVTTSGGDTTNKSLDKLDPSFMYTQILKEILLTIDFQQEHIKEFISYCREQFDGNSAELKNVDKLEKEYDHHTPVWWYTYHCFIYSMLNRALRTMEVDLIINMGFFIRDLHKHIAQLHSEQYTGNSQSDSFIVYRGQGLSPTDFDHLMQARGELLSFNNFLSTSKNRQTAFDFACETIQTADTMGILFVMKIDTSTPSTPFANVRDVSYYQSEEEILFSMHSIFRIGHMKQIDSNNGRLWQVELTLTSNNDPQLHALTAQIREETHPHKKGWDRLAELLVTLGQFNKARQLCELMLAQTSNDRDTANIYHMLGMVNGHLGKYTEAITFYKKSNKILQKILPPTHSDLASSYNNIGNVCYRVEDYSTALSFYEKALQIYEKTLPPNHPDLATAYSNIGSVNMQMDQHSTALSFYEKMLAVQQKSLPQNHPNVATSYNNIAALYSNMGEHSKALSSFEHAREIQEKILPPNHPNLSITYCNIGCVYAKMGNYSKALSFLQRALDIGQHSLPANHPHLQGCKNNIEIIKKKL